MFSESFNREQHFNPPDPTNVVARRIRAKSPNDVQIKKSLSLPYSQKNSTKTTNETFTPEKPLRVCPPSTQQNQHFTELPKTQRHQTRGKMDRDGIMTTLSFP